MGMEKPLNMRAILANRCLAEGEDEDEDWREHGPYTKFLYKVTEEDENEEEEDPMGAD